MDEQPIAASTTTGSANQPETLAELAHPHPHPHTAEKPPAKAGAKAGSGAKRPTPQHLVSQASAQVELLRQAETIKQLQNQVRLLEAPSRQAGKVFLGTATTLISSAFALVAALAWNDAIQALFQWIFPENDNQSALGLIFSTFGYAIFITIIVVIVLLYMTRLNTRLGGQTLFSEAPKTEGMRKE